MCQHIIQVVATAVQLRYSFAQSRDFGHAMSIELLKVAYAPYCHVEILGSKDKSQIIGLTAACTLPAQGDSHIGTQRIDKRLHALYRILHRCNTAIERVYRDLQR